jgi:HEAT repeat protein
MPTAFEIVEEARGFAEPFEQRWNLPWYTDKASSALWRHKLVHLIAHLPEGLFEDVIELLLNEKSFALRGIALHLARMRGARAFSARAVDLLSDASVNVRALAAAALGQFGDETAVEALLEVKDAEHTEVKKAVIEAMKRIRDVRCVPLLSRWAGKVGENDQLRKLACEALGTLGDDAGMPVLHRILADDTVADEIRGEAARAIGMIGGPESRRHLLAGMKDERPWIRARSIEGLAILGDQSATSVITPLLASTEPWMVRTAAIEALSRLAGDEALALITPLLSDKEIQIRSSVCVGLGLIGSVAAQRQLKTALGDNERLVRAQALEALSRASGRDFGFRLEQHSGSLDPKALDQAVRSALHYEPKPAAGRGSGA